MEKIIVDLENVVIALPEDKIIIEKSEYDALKNGILKVVTCL
ncbi:hypothetical protein [Streptococcus mutans]